MKRKILPASAFLMAFFSSAIGFASEVADASGIQDPTEAYGHLWREVMIDITIIGIIFALVTIYMLVRYRRKSPGQEGRPVKLSTSQVLMWALIPVFVFVADDFYLAAKGWTLWNNVRTPPENSYEIKLESAMWSWNFTYPGGVETINELRVPAGRPVVLRMTSRDTIHSLFLPDFRIKEDSMPGRITYMWFYPKEPGEHVLTCAEFCGVLHSSMHGKVIAMPEDEFNRWIEAERKKINKGGA